MKISLGDFRPLPLLGNAHVQTVLGHWFVGRSFSGPVRQQTLELADGDKLLLYDSEPPEWSAGDPMAVLVHGLTGTHASTIIQRLARALVRKGIRVVRIDMRGAGQGLPLARGFYHAGLTEDIRAVLKEVGSWSPTSPLYLLGVSLGGNLVLKLAAEADSHPVPNLTRVVAQGPPIDLKRCVALFRLAKNRMYERFFIRDLLADALRRQQCFPDLQPLDFPAKLTIPIYDELYTAPRNGFSSAEDYYERSSALPLIGRIKIPTLILTARDDPFIAAEPFYELPDTPYLSVHVAPRGGHLGFLGWDGFGGIRWAEHRLVEWLADPTRF